MRSSGASSSATTCLPPARCPGSHLRGRGRHDRDRRRPAGSAGDVPTQGADWRTQPRVGSPPIGTGSSFEVTDDPIEAQLRTLSALRDRYPALATSASVVRYAKQAILVVSRIDDANGTELVEAFNNGDPPARITVQTATTWTTVFGAGTAIAGAGSTHTLTVPPVSTLLARPDASIPRRAPSTPKLTGAADLYSACWRPRSGR